MLAIHLAQKFCFYVCLRFCAITHPHKLIQVLSMNLRIIALELCSRCCHANSRRLPGLSLRCHCGRAACMDAKTYVPRWMPDDPSPLVVLHVECQRLHDLGVVHGPELSDIFL